MALSACGGGDSAGNGESPSPATNTAPVFTSPTTASTIENANGPLLRVSANDAQANTIAFSIAGGADASAFWLDTTGDLYFRTPPNYDLYSDANGDNVYEVLLEASDGKLSSRQALAITVHNDREGIAVKRVATLGASRAIASLEDGHLLAIGGSAGGIVQVNGATGQSSVLHVFTDADGRPANGITVLGLAYAYTFGPNKSLYVLKEKGGIASIACIHCWYSRHDLDVVEEDIADISDGTAIILNRYQGFAYVAIGDKDGTHSQDTGAASHYGKIYNYPLDPDPLKGSTPNYFDERVVGIGVRAPSGLTTLPGSRLAVADRGETFDEISVTETFEGNNFGWPFYDGLRERNAGGAALPGLVTPALILAKGTGTHESRGIVAGLFYTGARLSINNTYLFADKDGHIFTAPWPQLADGGTLQANAIEIRDEDFKPDTGSIDKPVGFAIDALGDLYILDEDGELFRVDAPSPFEVLA
ncbi:PQQ-dependent sugar dehydrogenase [Novosphingobium sp. BL-8A]|uniref:PQQ-dependent sugar dehydrogenase n=1 Tax=Novosphingobium sp. BL-8A TaxID=3127639 RepID=UPI00375814EA